MAFNIDLSGKVVLVTGVSSGIGLGVAQAFARAGATVAGCARKSPDDAHIVRFHELVAKEHARSLYVRADVTVDSDLRSLADSVFKELGRIDILVSNAGMNVFEGAENCDDAHWEYNMKLNLESHWKIAKYCKPYLERSGEGTILLMTSNHAYASIPGCFPYNVAKSAITGLVRSLALEWTPAIRTVGVAPGFVDTQGNQTWFDSFPDPDAERRRTINLHPVKKIGTPEEIGALCVFLASPMASFICGTTILVDGGRSAVMQDD